VWWGDVAGRWRSRPSCVPKNLHKIIGRNINHRKEREGPAKIGAQTKQRQRSRRKRGRAQGNKKKRRPGKPPVRAVEGDEKKANDRVSDRWAAAAETDCKERVEEKKKEGLEPKDQKWRSDKLGEAQRQTDPMCRRLEIINGLIKGKKSADSFESALERNREVPGENTTNQKKCRRRCKNRSGGRGATRRGLQTNG